MKKNHNKNFKQFHTEISFEVMQINCVLNFVGKY